ncbi:hypothetical protein A2U01_0068301, partial [Trifolium medium]|nr:hypothetical protein [Trifolium medium]
QLYGYLANKEDLELFNLHYLKAKTD